MREEVDAMFLLELMRRGTGKAIYSLSLPGSPGGLNLRRAWTASQLVVYGPFNRQALRSRLSDTHIKRRPTWNK